MSVRHLYVHLPFCRTRCAYCDFFSEPIGPHLRAGRVKAYVERLSEELEARASSTDAIETIYVGGGTPAVLPGDLLLPLVRHLAEMQQGRPDREFTIEANPGTIDGTYLAALIEAGVTRLSLGVQSFSPRLRAALGRRCEQREIEQALGDARAAAGLGSRALRDWNLDLVFGIHGESLQGLAIDLDAAIAAGPSHISLYDLTYTPAFAARVARTAGAGAREAAGASSEEQLPMAVARLEAAGYLRYEISNFALPGHECRHNQAYWRGEDYVGVGAAAVSTVARERLTNPPSVERYIEGEPPAVETLSPRTRVWEKAMLGLRTAEGVVEAEVLPVLDPVARERLVFRGYRESSCGRLRLNPAFLDVSNAVTSTLLVPPGE